MNQWIPIVATSWGTILAWENADEIERTECTRWCPNVRDDAPSNRTVQTCCSTNANSIITHVN